MTGEQFCIVCDSRPQRRRRRCVACARYLERHGIERPWHMIVEAERRRDDQRTIHHL